MKIVFMEADTLGKDVNLGAFDAFGEVTVYGKSVPGENAARIRGEHNGRKNTIFHTGRTKVQKYAVPPNQWNSH